jgi:hypothetical protein
MTYEEAMEELRELSRDETTQIGLDSIMEFAEGENEERPLTRAQMEKMMEEAEVLMNELKTVEKKLI